MVPDTGSDGSQYRLRETFSLLLGNVVFTLDYALQTISYDQVQSAAPLLGALPSLGTCNS